MNALIADDDEFFRMALAGILRTQHSFKDIVEAESFGEADAIIRSRPDLRLASFDLNMPGMSGPRMLLSLRRSQPSITLVVVSGSSERALILEALEAGIHGFIPKTSGVAEVSRALGHVLRGDIFVPRSVSDVTHVTSAVGSADSRPKLTERQTQVLNLIARGSSNREIATELGLGEGTVKVHVAALFRTLGIKKRALASAALKAISDRP